MIQIIKTGLKEIDSLRKDYLNSLPAFQELYLEILVEDSEYYKIAADTVSIGYAIKTTDHILVEFYLADPYIPRCREIFKTLIAQLCIARIYCKSFDMLLLNCCLINSFTYSLFGSMFRDCIETEPFPANDWSIRPAEYSDYPFLLQQEGELYETPEELAKYLKGGNITLFQKENQLLGCGYLIRVHADWDYYDIGMWVHPDFRQRGIATIIISWLKNQCLKNNWNPICGCAIDNMASQKTLEKNGFVSKYKLIEFNVNNN